ncbi:MAG: ABC transporter permease [Planctomycetaceae bacterium]|nr:ABC transporter permease [Planctomycetaceae bacterium]
MALGVALVVTVLVIHGVISQAFQRSAQGYNLLIGPKVGKLDMVLSTVFYIKSPDAKKIPYRLYEEIASKQRYAAQVETAIPIAISEPYKDSPVIATYPEFFEKLKYGDDRRYTFRKGGESFAITDTFGAVLGSIAASRTGLRVGDTFVPPIGSMTNTKDEKTKKFVVRGILDPSGTPNDQAIFINLEGFYEILEGIDNIIDLAASKSAAGANRDASVESPGNLPKNELPKNNRKRPQELSAILIITTEKERQVQLTGTLTKEAETNKAEKGANASRPKLLQEFDTPPDIDERQMGKTDMVINPAMLAFEHLVDSDKEYNIQAVYPTREIAVLFENIIGNIQLVLVILACLVIVVAAIGMMVSIYNTMNERRQEIAIMRALGAKRRTVMTIILLESILLSLTGGLAGFIMGHGLIGILGPFIGDALKVPVYAFQFQPVEVLLLPGLTLLASIVGYLPAVIAYRTDVAQSLNP